MITAESAAKKVTRNSSHCKKLLIDNSATQPSYVKVQELTGEDSAHSPSPGNREPPIRPDLIIIIIIIISNDNSPKGLFSIILKSSPLPVKNPNW